MGKTIKSVLPSQSLLQAYLQTGDFLDCYHCKTTIDVGQAAKQAMDFPAWVRGLMWLRNLIVAPFGLKTDLDEAQTIGVFPVIDRNDNEVIMGFDDKHLDFRISIMTDGQHAYGATWVRRHNWFGRLYLALIMPFHIVIMRGAIGRIKQ